VILTHRDHPSLKINDASFEITVMVCSAWLPCASAAGLDLDKSPVSYRKNCLLGTLTLFVTPQRPARRGAP
jgi:hypothetical protein